MRKALCLALLVLTAVFITSTATAAAPPASCNGILVSSLAGQPGTVAELTRLFHQLTKDAGFPPGSFDAAGAQEHAGGVDECLAALGGG
jgi:hypothetical protein